MTEQQPDPVAVVTGASRGIGAHVVDGLLADGWTVVGLSRSGAVADGAHGFACDVTDNDQVESVVARVHDQFGDIDLLVNNAGVIEPELPLWEADPDTWWRVMEVNVRGVFHVTRAVVAGMVHGTGGRVVNMNSGAATRGRDVLSAYCGSKSALARITEAVDLAGHPHGVRAFDLMPGVVHTDMTASMDMHEGRTDWTDPDDVVALVVAMANSELDDWAGRFVRAGVDSTAALQAHGAMLDDGDRQVRLQVWGPDDPLA